MIADLISVEKIQTPFACPFCHSGLEDNSDFLTCHICQKKYKKKSNIPIFSADNDYWCNVSREKMQVLIAEAKESGDWLTAVKKHLVGYSDAMAPLHRADMQFFLPIDSDARILDAGCMWGGLTVPLSQYCKTIYALDKTFETLELLMVRAKQSNINNIIPVVSPIHHLPFPDHYFDCVVLNGVLEWLAFEKEVVLEKHWGGTYGKKNEQATLSLLPREMQLLALKELHRVLKPNGCIYIAIENRIGLPYFLGRPDDHMNIRFVPFLPRKLANYITKKVRGVEYKTYIYTSSQLDCLIKEAGFQTTNFYSVFPSYQRISRMVGFDVFNALSTLARSANCSSRLPVAWFWRCLPAVFAKYMTPSFAVIAGKNSNLKMPPRLLSLLGQQGFLRTDQLEDYSLVLASNRMEDRHPICFFLFNKKEKCLKYFCKVTRISGVDSLQSESLFLDLINKQIKSNELRATIPQKAFYFLSGGISCLVTTVLPGKIIKGGSFSYFSKACRYAEQKAFNSNIKKMFHIGLSLTRRHWLKKINVVMCKSLEWLDQFQRETTTEIVDFSKIVTERFDGYLDIVGQRGFLSDGQKEKFIQSKEKILKLSAIKIRMCFQHGDFDVCNILVDKKKVNIVDFEHLETDATPFFDVGNLLFGPVLADWRNTPYLKSFEVFLEKSGWRKYLKKWLQTYFKLASLDKSMLPYFIDLVILEQNAKNYPDYRDPYTFPLYGKESVDLMLRLKNCLIL